MSCKIKLVPILIAALFVFAATGCDKGSEPPSQEQALSDPVQPSVPMDLGKSFEVDLNQDKLKYYRVDIPENGYLRVHCSGVPEGITPAYRFLDDQGEVLQDTEKSNAIRVEPGIYYVAVQERWGKESPSNIQCTLEHIPEMDRYEPNDTVKEAVAVSLDEEIAFALYPRWDKDCFQVEVPAEGYLNVVVTEPVEDLTYNFRFVRLNDEDIFQPGQGEAIQDSEKSNAIRVTEGTYLVCVRDRWENMPQGLQAGKLKFVFTEEMDRHEPNDTVKEAAPVSLDEEIAFALYPRWDEDCFQVEVPAEGYLHAVVTEPVEDLTYNFRFVRLSDEDMFQPGQGDEIQDTEESNAIRVTKGTYLVCLRDRWKNKPGGFQEGKLKLVFTEEMDQYEPNNTVKEAAAVSLDEEIAFAIYPRWDKDYFQVEVAEAGVLKVIMIEPAADLTYNYFFGDAAGSKLQSSDSENSLQVEPGTYIIGIWDRWKNRPQSLQKGKARIVLQQD